MDPVVAPVRGYHEEGDGDRHGGRREEGHVELSPEKKKDGWKYRDPLYSALQVW